MNTGEHGEIMNLILLEFKLLGEKLTKRGLLAQQWKNALMPVDIGLAKDALRRWCWKSNNEPTLDKFMELVEELSRESYRRRTGAHEPVIAGNIVQHAITQFVMNDVERSEDDLLWARCHVELLNTLANQQDKSEPARCKTQREFYERIAKKYPQFETDCKNAIVELQLDLDYSEEVPF